MAAMWSTETWGILLEQLERRVKSRRDHRRVLLDLAHKALGIFRVRGHLALPEHIQRKADVAGLRESLGLIPRVLVVAPPLVDDKHAGMSTLRSVIPGNESL
jgi:hypothetical protein